MPRILITDDDAAICRSLELHYRQQGHDIVTAGNAAEAMARVEAEPFDAVVTDIRMPGEDGLSLMRRIRAARPNLPVIVMTAFQDLDSTVSAMQGGAVDYVPKPIDIGDLDTALDRAMALRSGGSARREAGDNTLVLTPEDGTSPMVGQSPAMQQVFKQIAIVSQSRATVLIEGESGTGKELVARAIHRASANAAAPFMAVNCAALVEDLLESEMFGHVKGAFTGAVSAHRGKIEMVGDGTLFLDEVAELSPAMQGKLLRVLEAREYSPVGSTAVLATDARFISATNADLAARVADGRFREDLYYRLRVMTIETPPLRDRRACFPRLVNHLLLRINRDLQRRIQGITSAAMDRLMAYAWPGNVRELENVLMKASVMERGRMITVAALPAEVRGDGGEDNQPAAATAGADPLSLSEMERRHIARVLEYTGWHKGRACEILGISRPKLQRQIERYGLKPD
ncbi:MAG: sigma-54-dependent Fis family transcriptional regulator [Hyphomicrobiales bacterium]|nr:sigma-54-dependent Fis family transcriptional regulator [Hyphomicrobiales bacterium]